MRLVAPVAHRVYVQWPEIVEAVPKARYAGNVFAPPMIFVSVGTHEAPFDRLLRAVFELDLDEELVVQHGPSTVRCDRATEFEYLPFDEVVELRPAGAGGRHARGRRLGDDLARERQAARS